MPKISVGNSKSFIKRASLDVMSPERQTEAMLEVMKIMRDPIEFEKFSKKNLLGQMKVLGISTQEDEHKGGGPGLALQGVIWKYITPAWETARNRASAGKDYVRDIAVNYMNQIETVITGAGLSGPNAQQNLQSILYGLAVLAAAWNLGLIQAIPGLTLYLIDILSYIATTAAALPANPMIQNALLKIAAAAAAYRYRNIPLGAYGIFISAVTPIFTALYVRGDQAFQAAFPNFGDNIAAGGAAQLQELKESLGRSVETIKVRLQAAAAAAQPGIRAIKGVGEAWRNYVNESIKKFINGLELAQSDWDAIGAFYKFLQEVGEETPKEAEIPEETVAQIADLIPPSIHMEDNIDVTNVVTGAVVMGNVISAEMSNRENPISAEEAAALLLSLGKNAAAANANANA